MRQAVAHVRTAHDAVQTGCIRAVEEIKRVLQLHHSDGYVIHIKKDGGVRQEHPVFQQPVD
jgi:hypothetical protein